MTERPRYDRIAPDAYRAMRALEDYVRSTGLEPPLLELVRLRASYLNGCAYCVDMHAKDARAAGESEQRLYAVPVWREAPFFTARERVALAWAESVTRLGADHVTDDLYEQAVREFGEKDLVELTLAVAMINAWNRMAISFRAEPVATTEPPT